MNHKLAKTALMFPENKHSPMVDSNLLWDLKKVRVIGGNGII